MAQKSLYYLTVAMIGLNLNDTISPHIFKWNSFISKPNFWVFN